MAPSIAEAPTQNITVPIKADPKSAQPQQKVKRAIDEEGGKTTASVSGWRAESVFTTRNDH